MVSVEPDIATADASDCPGCAENAPKTIVAPQERTFTGTQVLPGVGGSAVPIGTAAGGSACPGCGYRVVPICELRVGCQFLGPPCPDPQATRYAVFATRPPAPEVSEGFVCLGPEEQPVSVDDVTTQVRALVDELIPTDARVRVQPPGGALVNIPTIVLADGGREAVTRQFFAAGFAVEVTATPVSWTWTFEPGATRVFAFPGDPYTSGVDPVRSGRHATYTYARSGQRQLQVVVSWQASYVLPGVGAVPVGVVERPSPAVPLDVLTARSELFAG